MRVRASKNFKGDHDDEDVIFRRKLELTVSLFIKEKYYECQNKKKRMCIFHINFNRNKTENCDFHRLKEEMKEHRIHKFYLSIKKISW